MRAVVIDTKHLRRDAQIQQHPAWQEARIGIERLISGLRVATTPLDYFELHRELLSAFWSAQRQQDSDRRQNGEIRAAIAEAAHADDQSRVRALSQLLAAIDFEIDTLGALLSVLRCVADSLVWRLVGYHRGAIATLSEGTRVGRLSDGVGLQTELDELSYLWNERGIVAVHADITNCVRAGDLLSVESWSPRTLRLTESKHGSPGARGARQSVRLEQLTTLLNEGTHPTADRGAPLSLALCARPISTYLPIIECLLQTAKSETYVSEEIDEGVLVEAYDYREPAELPVRDFSSLHEQAARDRGWAMQDLQRQSVEFRRLRDRQETWGTQLPLALLPFSVADTTGLLMGPLDYAMTVHVPTLERRLSRDGTSVTIARDATAGEWFLRATRGPNTITMPAPSREQLMIEGFTVDTLCDLIAWFIEDAAVRRDGRHSVAVGFLADTELWSTRRD